MRTPHQENALRLSRMKSADVFLYNGAIARGYDYQFIELVRTSRAHSQAILFLVTQGGDPDAGYKISRYLQEAYDRHTVIVSGVCKSAGTLIAVGAHELAFSPYGELGPLDIQTYKTDNLAERQSGLTIQEALDALAAAAVRKHGQIFSSIITTTNAIVSFPTAAKASAELVNGLFAPIFAQIDPYDVGDKARAMRIATEYGKRLSAHTRNLKAKTLETLTKTYPSHSFVIDFKEAKELFNSVRRISDEENAVVSSLDDWCREEAATSPVLLHLSKVISDAKPKVDKASDGGRGQKRSARYPKGAKRAPNTANGDSRSQP